jgi:hypothetical protein
MRLAKACTPAPDGEGWIGCKSRLDRYPRLIQLSETRQRRRGGEMRDADNCFRDSL